MVDSLTVFVFEPAGAVGHHSFALVRPDRRTEVGLLAHAVNTGLFVALRGVTGYHNIPHFNAVHARPHAFDDAGSFVS